MNLEGLEFPKSEKTLEWRDQYEHINNNIKNE